MGDRFVPHLWSVPLDDPDSCDPYYGGTIGGLCDLLTNPDRARSAGPEIDAGRRHLLDFMAVHGGRTPSEVIADLRDELGL